MLIAVFAKDHSCSGTLAKIFKDARTYEAKKYLKSEDYICFYGKTKQDFYEQMDKLEAQFKRTKKGKNKNFKDRVLNSLTVSLYYYPPKRKSKSIIKSK